MWFVYLPLRHKNGNVHSCVSPRTYSHPSSLWSCVKTFVNLLLSDNSGPKVMWQIWVMVVNSCTRIEICVCDHSLPKRFPCPLTHREQCFITRLTLLLAKCIILNWCLRESTSSSLAPLKQWWNMWAFEMDVGLENKGVWVLGCSPAMDTSLMALRRWLSALSACWVSMSSDYQHSYMNGNMCL